MKIRKIIRELIEQSLDRLGEPHAKTIKKDILFLSRFDFKSYKNIENGEAWLFYEYEGETVFSAMIVHTGSSWKFKLKIDGKLDKSGEKIHGPFSNYNALVEDINKNMESNPMLHPENYNDDIDIEKIKMAEKLLHQLEQNADKLRRISSENLKDLRDIFKLVVLKKAEGFLIKDIIKLLENQYDDLNNLILKLQDVEKIDFYNRMEGKF